MTHLELVSGPMTWDVMEQISDDFMRVPVDDFHAVVFGASSFNCEKMVRSYRDGDGHVDVGLSFRPWLAPDDDTTACFVLMEEDRRSVGALVIHRPKVASVSEVPVRELLSRERYGPPDYMSPGPTWPKARVGFAWLPDAGCWEARGPVNPPGMGVYRKPGAQVCDATANRICGFP